MKQIYFKFSILLFLVVMGLSSAMAEVAQTVTGTATCSLDDSQKMVWNVIENGESVGEGNNVKFMLTSNSFNGQSKTASLYAMISNEGEVSISTIELEKDNNKYDITFTTPSSIKDYESITLTAGINNSGKGNTINITKLTITYSYTPVTLNLTSAGYATFCAPYDVVIPSGVTASKITGSSKSTDNEGEYKLSLEAVSNNLPAGTPVILSGEALEDPVTYIGVATVSEDQNNSGNYLTGVYTDGVTAKAGSYGLQVQNGKTAFYKASNGFNASKYRAYLTLPASSDAKMLSFGEITIPASISGVSTEAQVSSIFSASGAKCSSMQKGLNIVKMNDGSVKKVLVK